MHSARRFVGIHSLDLDDNGVRHNKYVVSGPWPQGSANSAYLAGNAVVKPSYEEEVSEQAVLHLILAKR